MNFLRKPWRIFGALGLLTGGFAGVESRAASLQLSSWIVYWQSVPGLAQLREMPGTFEDVAVFACQFNEQGGLQPVSPAIASALDELKKSPGSRKLFVTVTNDVILPGKPPALKDAAVLHRILGDPAQTDRHIRDILTIAGPYDGVDIDYENFSARDRESFSRFIHELAAALHQEGKLLSVTVQNKLHPIVKDGAYAIDWPSVSRDADQFQIMAYHYHHASGAPGAIAPVDWIRRLIRFAVDDQQVPVEKLGIVLTMTGFDWPAGQKGRTIDFRGANDLLAAQGKSLERSEDGSPHFAYSDGERRHEVWFDDGESLRKKIAAIRQERVRRIAFWRLGTGDPMFWKGLAERLDQNK